MLKKSHTPKVHHNNATKKRKPLKKATHKHTTAIATTTTTTKRKLTTATTASSTTPQQTEAVVIDETAPYISSIPQLAPTVQTNNIPPNIDPGAPRVSNQPPRSIIFNLMGWVHKNGGKVNPSVFYGTRNILRDKNSTDTGNWRGLALQDLAAGEVVAEVPIDLCLFPLELSQTALEKTGNAALTPKQVEFRNAMSAVIGSIPADEWQMRLGARLLAERASDASFYTPYIDSLPGQYPTFPLFYDQQTAKTLDYRPIHLELHKKVQMMSKLVKQLNIPENATPEQLTPLQRCALDAFNNNEVQVGDIAWGLLSTTSRAFASPLPVSDAAIGPDSNDFSIDGIKARASYNKCLIPLVDMLNHSFMPNCEVVFSRGGGENPEEYNPNNPEHRKQARVVLKTKQPIARGNELTISYTPPPPEGQVLTKANILTITPENEQEILTKLTTTSDMAELFKASLSRVPNITEDGLHSTYNNDKLLQHYGFTPGFNVADDISFNPDRSLFETALGLGVDITVGHSYLAGDVGKAEADEAQKKKLEEQHGSINTSAMPMMGVDNTYDTALVKLVLPTAQTFIEDQTFLLHSLLSDSNVKLTMDWRGPNDNLLGVCRVIAAGSHLPDVKRIHKSAAQGGAKNTNKLMENEIVSRQWSEDQVHGSLQYEATKIFKMAERRAGALLAAKGEVVTAVDEFGDLELNGKQLFEGFCAGPLSPENEVGAMIVLYHTLVLASGGFTTGIQTNVEGYYKALIQQQSGAATAHLYARSKKMLTTHALKTLSTRLGLDRSDNNFHTWHTRLETLK